MFALVTDISLISLAKGFALDILAFSREAAL